MKRSEDYRADLLEDLRSDPEYAAEYLSAAKADSAEAFLIALRDVIEARSSMMKLAKAARLNRENLYRTLSMHGNPRFQTFDTLLSVLGFEVKIVPKHADLTPVVSIDVPVREPKAVISCLQTAPKAIFLQSSLEPYIAISSVCTSSSSVAVNAPDVPRSLVALEQKSQEPSPRLVAD